MILNIALGVALGILLATGLLYAGWRWGDQAIGFGQWLGELLWRNRRRAVLVIAAVLLTPVVVVLVDYAGIRIYENMKRDMIVAAAPREPYDAKFNPFEEIRNTRWVNEDLSEFVHVWNRAHMEAVKAYLDWRSSFRDRLCHSRWRDWRPAMLIMGPECRMREARRIRQMQDAARYRLPMAVPVGR